MDTTTRCPECGGPTVTSYVDAGGDPPVMIPGTYRCAVACQAGGRRPVEVATIGDTFVEVVPGEPYGQ